MRKQRAGAPRCRVRVRGVVVAIFAITLAGFSSNVSAHDEPVHRDATAYAFEIMAVARNRPLQSQFEGDAAMLAFLDEMYEAVADLEALPNDLPQAPRDRCIDLEAITRFGNQMPLAGTTPSMPAGVYPVAVDIDLTSAESSCGADAYWQPGTLYREANPGKITNAGNVLGYWAAYPDYRHGETELQWRPTASAPVNQIKTIVEQAAGAVVGPVWITVKCFTDCMKGVFLGDLDECGQCIEDSAQQVTQGVRDGIAEIDGLALGIGLGGSEHLTGMCHHIDTKSPFSAPGWPASVRPRYDDMGGLYGLTAGPYNRPGAIEMAAIAASEAGITIDYDASEGARLYQIADGKDFHQNSKLRGKEDFEFKPWPYIPMTPVDNLAWYGWNEYRKSVTAAGANPGVEIQTRYLGWVLHGIGDATVPMHTTSTFGWGHSPYEDAESSFKRELLGEYSAEVAIAARDAAQIVKRAKFYRQMVLDWRSLHPEKGADVPVRDLVTHLAKSTASVGASTPGIYNDALSTAWVAPGPTKTQAREEYKAFKIVMKERLVETVAATIAFLMSVPEVRP